MEITQIIQVVETMYAPGAQADYKEADSQLKAFQKSSEAWSVISELLSRDNLSEMVYLFAAQSLKVKLSYDFAQLQGTDLSLFRSNLLSLCLKFAEIRPVMRQLAQSVGILAVYTVDIWGSLLSDIQQALSGKPVLLLEVLTCLAEETEDENIVADAELFSKLQNLLAQNSEDILTLLHGYSSTHSIKVLETFLALLKSGLSDSVVLNLPNSWILALSFQAFSTPNLFVTASYILTELLRATQEYSKYAETVKSIVSQLLPLKPTVFSAIQAQNEEVCEGYARVFYTLGKKHISLIIEEEAVELLEILEALLHSNSLTSLKLANDFWERFFRALGKLDSATVQAKKEKFMPVLNKVLPLCLSYCKLEPSLLYSISPDDPLDEDTEEMRATYACTILDLGSFLDAEGTYNELTNNLSNLAAGAVSVEVQEKHAQIEAIVRCLAFLSEAIGPTVPALRQSVIAAVHEFWPVYQLNQTVCMFLHKISYKLHVDTIQPVMAYLVQCVQQEALQGLAASAIKEVCCDNAKCLEVHIDSILSMQSLAIHLKLRNHEYILQGISEVVWRSSVHAKIIEIASVYATPVKTAVDNNAYDRPMITHNLDCLGLIFRGGTASEAPVETLYYLFKALWPVIKSLFQNYASDLEMIEKLCRIVKHSIRKLIDLFSEFLEDLLTIMNALVPVYCQSSFFYIAENLVRTLGNKQELQEPLSRLFNSMSTVALSRLTSLDTMNENPDLTEDFFGMGIRYLNYATETVIQSPSLPSYVNTAKIAIGLPHKEAAECLYSFLETLVDLADQTNIRYLPQAENLFLEHFSFILRKLISAVIDVPSHTNFHSITDLIQKIQIVCTNNSWLMEALSTVPHDCLTDTEKYKMLMESKDPRKVCRWMDILYKRSKRRATRIR